MYFTPEQPEINTPDFNISFKFAFCSCGNARIFNKGNNSCLLIYEN